MSLVYNHGTSLCSLTHRSWLQTLDTEIRAASSRRNSEPDWQATYKILHLLDADCHLPFPVPLLLLVAEYVETKLSVFSYKVQTRMERLFEGARTMSSWQHLEYNDDDFCVRLHTSHMIEVEPDPPPTSYSLEVHTNYFSSTFRTNGYTSISRQCVVDLAASLARSEEDDKSTLTKYYHAEPFHICMANTFENRLKLCGRIPLTHVQEQLETRNWFKACHHSEFVLWHRVIKDEVILWRCARSTLLQLVKTILRMERIQHQINQRVYFRYGW